MADENGAQAVRGRWAPWWVYLVALLGANYLRQAILPTDSWPVASVVALVAAISAVLFVGITVAYRRLGTRR